MALATFLSFALLLQSPPPATPATGVQSSVNSPPVSGGAPLLGEVIDVDTKRPVPGVIVVLRGTGTYTERVMSDVVGRFVFPSVPTGRYELVTEKPGWIPGSRDRTRTAEPFQSVSVASRTLRVKLYVSRTAAIGGTVSDDLGEPVVQAEVTAFRQSIVAGLPQLLKSQVSITDDRGVYRLHGLVPGNYVLSANSRRTLRTSGHADDGQKVYVYGPQSIGPSVASNAGLVTLESGAERLQVDFRLSLVVAVPLHGRVIGPVGPEPGVSVRLIPSGLASPLDEVRTLGAVSNPSGDFEIRDVPVGEYVLQASKVAESQVWWTEEALTLTARTNVALQLAQGLTVAGRVLIAGASGQPSAIPRESVTVTLEPAAGNRTPIRSAAAVRPDGRFTTAQVIPGEYVLRMTGLPPGWEYTATLNDKDVSDTKLTLRANSLDGVLVSVTDRPPEVAGRVEGVGSDLAAGVSVFVFPTNQESWTSFGRTPRRLREVRTDAAGRYVVRGLPPGNYFVTARTASDIAEWRDPAILKELAKTAETVVLDAGDRKLLDLHLERQTPIENEPQLVVAGEGAAASTGASLSDRLDIHGPMTASPDFEQVVRDQPGRPSPNRSSSITGIIVSGSERATRPLSGVQVVLRAAGPADQKVSVTDTEGRFSFGQLAGGRYVIVAAKPGYVTQELGATHGGGAGLVLAVSDGEDITAPAIRLVRGAVLTGMITDELGSPAMGVQVSLRQVRSGALRPVVPQGQGSGITDDQGIYRFYGLAEGEYVVFAVPRLGGNANSVWIAKEQTVSQVFSTSGEPLALDWSATMRRVTYAPVFFPGTTEPSLAQRIRLAPEEERTAVDIQMQVTGVTDVRGTVHAPSGVPIANLSIAMRSEGGQQFGVQSQFRPQRSAGGEFTFVGVTPGTYTIVARTEGDPRTSLWGSVQIAVGETPLDVMLPLQPTLTLSGRVVLEGSVSDASRVLENISLRLMPDGEMASNADMAAARIGANGRFQVLGIAPGRYVLSAVPIGAIANSWAVKSVLLNGRETVDIGFGVDSRSQVPEATVTLTSRHASLSGALQSDGGHSADYSLVLFPKDRSMYPWRGRRVQSARPSSDGRFLFRAVPAGEYWLAAVSGVDPAELLDPSILERLVTTATAVSITEGEKKEQHMRVIAER